MIYMRGQAADYDHWRQLGLTGWGWDDVLPFFKQHENHFLGESDASRAPAANGASRRRACAGTLLDAFREAAEQAGIKRDRRFQHRRQRRLVRISTSTRSAGGAGRRRAAFSSRCSAGRTCGSRPAVWSKPSSSTASARAGVRWRQDGETSTRALPRRGDPRGRLDRLGAAAAALRRRARRASLRDHGIPVVLDKPGVGAEPAGPSAAAADLQGVGRQDAERDLSLAVRPRRHGARLCAAPPRPAHHGALAARPVHALRSRRASAPTSSFTCSRCRSTSSAIRCTPSRPSPRASAIVQPTSRGFVRLRSADPADKPVIKPNYLSTDEDRRVAADSIRVARNIAAQPALAQVPAGRVSAGARGRQTTMRRWSRPRATSAPRSSIRSAPPRWAARAIRSRWSTSGCA